MPVPLADICHSSDPATRAGCFELAAALIAALLPRLSPGRARLLLGNTGTHYDETAAELEGYSRALWGVVPLLAGHRAETSGVDAALIAQIECAWRDGLINGTDPAHAEYWGAVRDRDQRMVEMCAIGFALTKLPGVFWEPLTSQQRANVARWLGDINGREMPRTNWRWFRVMANIGLRTVGASTYSTEVLYADLDFMDTFHVERGWNADGPVEEGVKQMDYYSASFALQFAPLLYVCDEVAQRDDAARCQRFRERAAQFAEDFVCWFDDAGRAVPFGRSMTYRFAMVAYWPALAYAGLTDAAAKPLNNAGVTKGIWARNIRWFIGQRGVLRDDGTFSIGYTYENLFLTENYNSPGSPYWAFLALLPLALPSTHDWWRSEGKALPSSELPSIKALKPPGHIAIRHGGNHAYVLSAGQQPAYRMRHGAQKYCKLAYSSAFGYSVPTGASGDEQHALDSTFALSDDGGETFKVPRQLRSAHLDEARGCLTSSWMPWPGVLVETWLVAPAPSSLAWHVRAHRLTVTDAAAKTAAPTELLISDGSFAVSDRTQQGEKRRLEQRDQVGADSIYTSSSAAFVASHKGAVGIRDITPGSASESDKQRTQGVVVPVDASSNIIAPRTSVACLQKTLTRAPSARHILVSAVFAMVPRDDTVGLSTNEIRKAWEVDVEVPKWLEEALSA